MQITQGLSSWVGYEAMGEGNWVEIEGGDSHYRESIWFYALKFYHGSDLLVTEIDGDISERFTYSLHWFGKGVQ